MSRPLPDFSSIRVVERRLPDWLRRSLAEGQEAARTDALIEELGLHTICESARCPNRNECYSQRTATFMILGDICTRRCGFCSVSTGRPLPVDEDEPRRVAEAARALGLQHVVVTSVDRDDLPDEGSSQFVAVVHELHRLSGNIIIEVLTPDFKRNQEAAVGQILEANVEIFSHNMETVPRLYRSVRPGSDYERSLEIFRTIRRQSRSVLTKSALMLGLGETESEVLGVMRDLERAGCQMFTLGQYLQSSGEGLPVHEYVPPAVFARYREEAFQMGFQWVESGPFVRSSYHAKESFQSLLEVARKGSSDAGS